MTDQQPQFRSNPNKKAILGQVVIALCVPSLVVWGFAFPIWQDLTAHLMGRLGCPEWMQIALALPLSFLLVFMVISAIILGIIKFGLKRWFWYG